MYKQQSWKPEGEAAKATKYPVCARWGFAVNTFARRIVSLGQEVTTSERSTRGKGQSVTSRQALRNAELPIQPQQ